MFLGWYDPDKKKATGRKLADAIYRYERKWGRKPSVALVNASDVEHLTDDTGVEVRVAPHVAPNTFFVGDDEPEESELAAA
jgi:hypothetical protein